MRSNKVRVAIAQTRGERRFYISLDGIRFRQVPQLPIGLDSAETLFHRAGDREREEVELIDQFGGRITFMLMPR